MMIRAIVVVSILISLIFSGIYHVNKAYCWDCTPKRCYYDLECGSGCWCDKDDFELDGDCVTE